MAGTGEVTGTGAGTGAERLPGFLWRFFRGYRGRAAVVIACSITYSVLEAVGIASLLPVLERLVDTGAGTSPVSRRLEDLFGAFGVPFTVGTVLAFVAVLFLGKCVAEYSSIYLGAALAKRHRLAVLRGLFRDYAGARWEYVSGQRVGHLLNTLTTETAKVAAFVKHGMAQVTNVVFSLVLLGMSFLIAPQLTGFAVVFLVVSGAVVASVVPRARRAGAQIVGDNRGLGDLVTQYLTGYKTLKAFDAFDEAATRVDRVAERREEAELRIARADATLAVAPEVLLLGVLAGSVYVSLNVVGAGVAELGVVVALLFRVSQRAKMLRGVATLGSYLPSLESVARTLDDFRRHQADRGAGTAREAGRGGGTAREAGRGGGTAGSTVADTAGSTVPFEQAIAFDRVAFDYAQTRDRPAIEGVDLSIRRGETVGVVGASGAGKSTLTGLLLGLLEPTSGTITVDGRPLGDLPPGAWARTVGYVPQESFLLNDTVRENIAFLRPLRDERVVHAATLAHVHAFVESLPLGYDTPVGNNGVELSGGERQRICLARALAGSPRVLVLDEATSSLDSVSEQRVQQAIDGLRGEVTMVVIAHRLSTVIDADRLLVLERGRLVESGTPRELLTRPDGLFRNLYDLQRRQRHAA